MSKKKELKAKYKKKVYAFSLKDAVENGEATVERVKNELKKELGEDVEEIRQVIREDVSRVNSYGKDKQKFWLDRLKGMA